MEKQTRDRQVQRHAVVFPTPWDSSSEDSEIRREFKQIFNMLRYRLRPSSSDSGSDDAESGDEAGGDLSDRRMQRAPRAQPTPPECALAVEMFDHFCSAGTMKQILALHREICNTLNLKPTKLPDFYPKLKDKLSSSWKAQALFKKFDARASHKVYMKGRACPQTKVLIIGAGPCGLRAAIECQLLGAKVVVVEKRCQVSRNNVLHLWPFVIQDLRALGAKKFFGKFCAGSIDHISIRQLQCILLKVALLLGVELHEGVSFEGLLEPTITDTKEILGWRAKVLPEDHPVCHYEFDILLGADGKRNTLQGFKRKEFRGKLAMAITANFINRHTEAEASVPEISGVAFIFNQKFFKDLNAKKGINLENIVYYNDDTHYFVMTVKKQSLLDKGVIIKDFPDVARLLSVENVDRSALMAYAQEAARFSTDGLLPLRDFALNHYGEPDVALFDFTSMYAAENASMVYERLNRRLLCQLVGDSLLEPFWPTGSGCARGFLSALDASWAVRAWGSSPPPHPLNVIAERESIYRLLAQTTPENLSREFGGYTLDPGTRYPNLNRTAVTANRVTAFYNSDEPLPLDATISTRKRRRDMEVSEEVLLKWLGVEEGGVRMGATGHVLTRMLRRYRPDLLTPDQLESNIFQILHEEFGLAPPSVGNLPEDFQDVKLRNYLIRIYHFFKGEVPHIDHKTDVFDQIKQNQQKEKHSRNIKDHSVSAYTSAAEAEKSHSSYRKKRRAQRASHVSNDSEDYIIKKIGKLDLNDITQLARLIEGHDAAAAAGDPHYNYQRSLQDEILSLLEDEESPDPQVLRESLAQLLQGSSQMRVKETAFSDPSLGKFFSIGNSTPPVKPPRRLKGLDPTTIKYVDLSDDDDTLVLEARKKPQSAKGQRKLKGFIKSNSIDAPAPPESNLLDIVQMHRRRNSDSPAIPAPSSRASSTGPPEVKNTRRIADMFEDRKRHYATSPDSPRFVRPNLTPEKAERMQRMNDILVGKTRSVVSPDRSKPESIGHPELALRKQRVVELIEGRKPMEFLSPDSIPKRKNQDELSFKLQRMSDLLHRPKPMDLRRQKGGTGRRKAAREIMKQRFEKSIQLLAAEPTLTLSSSLDLENDIGLQQYRASAPQFGDRVKKLERKLQHYEEGRLVGGKGRNLGNSGARVARLAAELSGVSPQSAVPAASKPKDLLRSVGKIERDDWNVKKIEDKIMENRLGRPEPKTAEKVPKWDKAQFLGRQRRLKEGDGSDEKYGEIDETLSKLGQKLRDSGRPEHGTKKVASLANKFVKQDETKEQTKQEEADIQEEPAKQEVQPQAKSWRGPATAGMQCAACKTRVFAAECVTADGLHLHKACFRCAICKAVLRPGNYTMERYGSRLVCLRHSGVSVPDAVAAMTAISSGNLPKRAETAPMPERISVEVSDTGKRELDEDEWTDRNFLASETSGAGGLSDSDEMSSEEYADAGDSGAEAPGPAAEEAGQPLQAPPDMYHSDDSYGYDDYSEDEADSSGNESCSRMRAALEARRREVPADNRPPTDTSEETYVEDTDSESDTSSTSSSSGTAVSTDSEFEREEGAPPPAILVTAPAAPPPQPHEFAIVRARSSSGLANKKTLQLKRKYLLGEYSPPAVRKSESTSHLDTKLEAFRSNISEFQKLLHPAPTPLKPTPQAPIAQTPTLQMPNPANQYNTTATKKPMPDIISNLLEDGLAPVDLLTKGGDQLKKKEYPKIEEDENQNKTVIAVDIEYDSLSEASSHTKMGKSPAVPRLEVHDEGGELIDHDSQKIANVEKAKHTLVMEPIAAVAQDSDSSQSCRDANTLPLTEADLSDWAIDSHILEDSVGDKEHKKARSSRSLSGPKRVHDARNVSAIASHVCGRSSPNEPVHYNNAADHFEFADEGEQDLSLENPIIHKNNAYGEYGEEDYNIYSPVNDRSMNFIERSFSDTAVKPSQDTDAVEVEEEAKTPQPSLSDVIKSSDSDSTIFHSKSTSSLTRMPSFNGLNRINGYVILENKVAKTGHNLEKKFKSPTKVAKDINALGSPKKRTTSSSSFDSPSLVSTPPKSAALPTSPSTIFKFVSTSVCRSASETFHRPQTRITISPSSVEVTVTLGSGSGSPVSAVARDTSHKVEELKRAREEQTEVVRRLVLERLGSGRTTRKSSRRMQGPPPVPPPPEPPLPPPPPPPPPLLVEAPRPAQAHPLPVTPSFSDPELARVRRRNTIIRSLSNYFNRRLGPRTKWASEPDLTKHVSSPPTSKMAAHSSHKSTGALEEAPPVPPPPARYRPPHEHSHAVMKGNVEVEAERDAMQLGFEARWARLLNQRRARDYSPREEPAARRVASLVRKLSRPLSAEQQAAAVAELVQVSAQRDAHQAMMAADRRRSAGYGGVCD